MIKRFETYCKERKEPGKNEILLLLEEVNSVCPKCGKPLVEKKGNRTYNHFEIAHVFPNSPTLREQEELKDVPLLGSSSEDLKNKIPLCYDCHDEYDNEKTVDMYQEMYDLKCKCLRETEVKRSLAYENLEDELASLIKKLDTMSNKQLEEIKEPLHEVLTIEEKIPATELLLRQEVTLWVTSYFSYIAKCFKNVGFMASKYDIIRSRIRLAYKIAYERGLSTEEIYEKMIEWFQTHTQSRRRACAIMVTYFIQNCDIYGKSPE